MVVQLAKINRTDKSQPCIIGFSVADTGIGIAADKLQYVFERFSQADSSVTRRFGGTGLGQRFAKKQNERMGGESADESQPGKGSTFHFTLPLDVPDTSDTVQTESLPDMSGIRIMVVDDNPTNRLMIRRTLSAWNIDTTEADSGKEALDQLQQETQTHNRPHDLILIDRQMPGMDGVELASRIRENARFHSAAIIMMSSDSATRHLSKKDIPGIRGYLLKPIKRSDLKALLQNVLLPDEDRTKGHYLQAASLERIRPLSLLHVEDAANNRLLIRSYLKNTPFSIEEAENGQIAVEKIQSTRYDLVLMDMQMPVMDGYTATKRIRDWEKEKGLPPVPVIALSAHVLKTELDMALAAGCNLYLTKPVKKSDLMEAIRSQVVQIRNNPTVTISKDLEDLIPQFMENTGKDIVAMSDALARQDMETVRRIGHSMKSYGSGYGFDSISALGRSMEEAAKAGNGTLIRQILIDLEYYLNKVTVIYDE